MGWNNCVVKNVFYIRNRLTWQPNLSRASVGAFLWPELLFGQGSSHRRCLLWSNKNNRCAVVAVVLCSVFLSIKNFSQLSDSHNLSTKYPMKRKYFHARTYFLAKRVVVKFKFKENEKCRVSISDPYANGVPRTAQEREKIKNVNKSLYRSVDRGVLLAAIFQMFAFCFTLNSFFLKIIWGTELSIWRHVCHIYLIHLK